MKNKFKICTDLGEINKISIIKDRTLIAKLKYHDPKYFNSRYYNWKIINNKLFGLNIKINEKK